MKILFIGDIVGQPGRLGVARILPAWRQKYAPDLVIANAENAAHGVGITTQIFEELQSLGIDFFTTGNHWYDKEDGLVLFGKEDYKIIRPGNWPGKVMGHGWKQFNVKNTPVAVINLMGQVFIKERCDSPFHALDGILKEISAKIVILDMHAEATSEMQAMGYYADGRVSAVIGTHTHVPTADAQVLEKGTAYITDVGMCGADGTIIGVQKEGILASFLDQFSRKHEIPDASKALVRAFLLNIDDQTGRAQTAELLSEKVDI